MARERQAGEFAPAVRAARVERHGPARHLDRKRHQQHGVTDHRRVEGILPEAAERVLAEQHGHRGAEHREPPRQQRGDAEREQERRDEHTAVAQCGAHVSVAPAQRGGFADERGDARDGESAAEVPDRAVPRARCLPAPAQAAPGTSRAAPCNRRSRAARPTSRTSRVDPLSPEPRARARAASKACCSASAASWSRRSWRSNRSRAAAARAAAALAVAQPRARLAEPQREWYLARADVVAAAAVDALPHAERHGGLVLAREHDAVDLLRQQPGRADGRAVAAADARQFERVESWQQVFARGHEHAVDRLGEADVVGGQRSPVMLPPAISRCGSPRNRRRPRRAPRSACRAAPARSRVAQRHCR